MDARRYWLGWMLVGLVGLVGCGATGQPPQPGTLPGTGSIQSGSPSPGVSPTLTPTPVSTPSVSTPSASAPAGLPERISTPIVQAPPSPSAAAASATESNDPTIQRDYDSMTPLPSTGRVTRRDTIRTVDNSQLIEPCPTDTAPYALAESTHYRVQVCSAEYDPAQPKYYIGQDKSNPATAAGMLHITSHNPDEARQLIFRNGDYTYVIYRDGRMPERMNAYLEIYPPDGRAIAEALLYLYE